MKKFLYASLFVNLISVLALAHSASFSYETIIQRFIRYRGKATFALLGDSQTAMGTWNTATSRVDMLVIGRHFFTSEQLIPDTKTISRFHPKVCFIMAGTNDASSSSFSLNRSKSNFITLVRNLTRANVKPVLITIPYRIGQELVNKRIDSLNNVLRTIVSNERIDLIELGNYLNKGHSLNEKYSADSVHLNENGRQLWAGLLQEYIHQNKL